VILQATYPQAVQLLNYLIYRGKIFSRAWKSAPKAAFRLSTGLSTGVDNRNLLKFGALRGFVPNFGSMLISGYVWNILKIKRFLAINVNEGPLLAHPDWPVKPHFPG
jgi:hypothetical protein